MSSMEIKQPCIKSSASISYIWFRLRIEAEKDDVVTLCLQLVSPCSAGEVLQKASCSLFKVLVLCENTERDSKHLLQAGRASGMEGMLCGAGPGFPSSGLFLLVGP